MKKPRLNDQQFSLQMQGVSDIYAQMQIDLFDSMIKRLKERGNADLQDNPYIWQLEKLNEMHLLNEHNLAIIVERTGIAESLLREVIENEGLKVYQDTKEQLEEDMELARTGEVRNGVTDALEAYSRQAISDLNLINTTLPASIQAVYKSVVERTVAEVVAGTKTSDRALHDTIMGWQKRGFTGFIDRAGRRWRADVYARAVIKSTTYSVYNEMRTRPAEEVGIDTFYYSIKRTARPACSPIQAKIVTKGESRVEQGVKVYSLQDYGYGTAGGCLGVHCGHYLTPFIVGVNNLPELPDYLKDLTPEQAEDNARIEAKQRALERSIRNQKERLHIAKQLKDDELVKMENLKLRNLQGKMRNLVASHDFLHRDYTRERYYPNPMGMEKQEVKQRKHLEKVQADYENIKKILGDDAPATIAKYQRLLYNGGRELEELKEAQKWAQTTFPTKKSFEGHFVDHGKEFGAQTAEEYQMMAAHLLSQVKSDKILGYDTETRRVRYDRMNNAIAIGKVNKNGMAKITTFFKPKDGEEYYHNDYEAEHRHD